MKSFLSLHASVTFMELLSLLALWNPVSSCPDRIVSRGVECFDPVFFCARRMNGRAKRGHEKSQNYRQRGLIVGWSLLSLSSLPGTVCSVEHIPRKQESTRIKEKQKGLKIEE